MASKETQPLVDWEVDQLEVILDHQSTWQLVTAGPGTGKSAVACQRIAFLVDSGVPPSRILMISFTRTAVAELRDRIVSYAVAGPQARGVRISTIDSQAWSLRTGFEDNPLPQTLGFDGYDIAIGKTVGLLRAGQPELCEFVGSFGHVIIDEAQDIVGVRKELILELLAHLDRACGVTILADPAQAIYGFTTDADGEGMDDDSLLSDIEAKSPRTLVRRTLKKIHRIKDPGLVDLFLRTRKEVEVGEEAGHSAAKIQKTIRETCGKNLGIASYENIADFLAAPEVGSSLVLFRWRADVLFASSFCSNIGIHHQLRMSGLPVVVRPWIGWLFQEFDEPMLARDDFNELWRRRHEAAPPAFDGMTPDDAWALLHRFSAGMRKGTVNLEQLRILLSRSHPPMEFCYPEVGARGPILGTIHASKGRESDTVILVLPAATATKARANGNERANGQIPDGEAKVYYVGATRARKMLITFDSSEKGVGYLDSKRIYRVIQRRAQLEIGRQGDVDPIAHLSWHNSATIQHALAQCATRQAKVEARSHPDWNYEFRIVLDYQREDGVIECLTVGQLSPLFRADLGKLWSSMDTEENLKPAPNIQSLHLVAVSTVALSEEQRAQIKAPFNRSGFALVPVVKGFPTIPFFFRRTRRN